MSWVLRPWKPQWLIIYSNAFLLSQGWWNRSSQSGFGGPLFCIPVPWHAWVHTCNGQYQQLWLQVAVGAFLCEWWVVSWVLHARLSFSSKKNERHKGSFVYQTESEIAAYRMWYIKWNLSANSHVLCTSRARRSQKLQSSGSEARRCCDGPSRQLKNGGEKNFLCWSALHTSIHCPQQWLYHSKRPRAAPVSLLHHPRTIQDLTGQS